MKCLRLISFLLSIPILGLSQSTFINEINYLGSNPGQAGVEIAGAAGQDLSNWEVITYNLTGVQVGSLTLSGLIPNQENGYGTFWYDVEQNSGGGGVALFNPSGIIVMLLSYGATDPLLPIIGGLTAEYIGEQPTTTDYLQLKGTGNSYPDFAWEAPGGNTEGAVNANQSFSALPVELVMFRAQHMSQDVLIQWVTASELNNEQFILEKSYDGENFLELERIDGAGTSLLEHHYFVVDDNLTENLVYYRLGQVDFDNTISHSPIVSVHIESSGFNHITIINPVKDQISIRMEDEVEEAILVQIFDFAGHILLKKSIAPEEKYYEFDVSTLPSGEYILNILSNNKMHTELIIKE